MKQAERQKTISRALKLGLVLTGLFGISSAVFLVIEDRHVSGLKKSSAVMAASARIEIDKAARGKYQDKVEFTCTGSDKTSCKKYLEAQLETKNWAEDWRIFFTNQLGNNEPSVAEGPLKESQAKIDREVKGHIGISFREARETGILTIETLMDEINKKGFNPFTAGVNRDDEQRVIDEVERLLAAEAGSIPTAKRSETNVLKALGILIALETILFCLVNSIDVANNNVNARANSGDRIGGVRTKVIPLVCSLALTLAGMMTSQLLIARQERDNLIAHCRETGQHKIAMASLIRREGAIRAEGLDLSKLKPTEYCIDLLEKRRKKDIKSLNAALSSDKFGLRENLEIVLEMARISSDSYQETQSTRSQTTTKLLLTILGLNVGALAFMAIFIGYDSKDIE